MTKEFEAKVMKEEVVDTKNYRYVYEELADKAIIKRIAIAALDTTEAINGWEVVKKVH